MTNEARMAALEMRERCAELLEAKAKRTRSTIEGPTRTHDLCTYYGRQVEAEAIVLEKTAIEIRALPLLPATEDQQGGKHGND